MLDPFQTSYSIANARLKETKRSDGLFQDPFAEALTAGQPQARLADVSRLLSVLPDPCCPAQPSLPQKSSFSG